MFHSELIKMRRSSTWIIAVLLPVLAIVTGTINLASNPEVLDAGWASFTSQVVLFYGLLFFSMGVSLLAATAWRVEHQGANWSLLLTSTSRPVRLALAKIGVILLPVTLMQFVLVVGTAISGTLILRLEGQMPWEFVVVGIVSIVAALPLVAAQSLLSMLMRSFAAPVALCLIGCVVGVATVTSLALRPMSLVLPQALITRSINLGSTAIAGSAGLTVSDTVPLILTSVGIGASILGLTVLALRVVKLR